MAKTLLLSNNNITHIPHSVSFLEHLEYLDISSNKITQIDKELCNLQKLYRIDIYENSINNFPNCLENKLYLDYDRYNLS